MKFKILQANNGDSIHLRFKDEEENHRNILIDGGTCQTYLFKNKKGKMQDGKLKQLIEIIKSRNEFIDLLILTHIDDDHIGGILKWFGQDKSAKDLVKRVWFNSGRLISEYFQQEESKENLLMIEWFDDVNTSIVQGVAFEDFITDNNIWDRRILKNNGEIRLFGLKFIFLSPSVEKLKLLLGKWTKECPIMDTSCKNDYQMSISELIASDSFKEDYSIHNGSSLAFIIENEDRCLLFLGDAHPQTIIESLKVLGYSQQNPIKADFVKLSHHGSKANTNIELLNLIQSENFLVSSNGSSHSLPDKNCLARIIGNYDKVNLYFNYPELAEYIFTKKDFEDFSNFTVMDAQNYI